MGQALVGASRRRDGEVCKSRADCARALGDRIWTRPG